MPANRAWASEQAQETGLQRTMPKPFAPLLPAIQPAPKLAGCSIDVALFQGILLRMRIIRLTYLNQEMAEVFSRRVSILPKPRQENSLLAIETQEEFAVPTAADTLLGIAADTVAHTVVDTLLDIVARIVAGILSAFLLEPQNALEIPRQTLPKVARNILDGFVVPALRLAAPIVRA